MDSTQVCVFKQTNKVRLSSLLKGRNGSTLEAQIGLEVLQTNTKNNQQKKKNEHAYAYMHMQPIPVRFHEQDAETGACE